MSARHISSPENGPQNTAISSQKSVTTDFLPQTAQADLDGHACPISRNSRAQCRAWESGRLSPALRCFAQHHNWHEPGHITNKLKLRLAFAKPIRTTVNEFLADRRDGLAEQIRGDFAHLQEAIHTIDRMCGKQCDEEDELGRLEHTKAQLKRSILELADLIESGVQAGREIVDIPPVADDGQWITVTEAAGLLGKNRGTISHWAKIGKVRDNGKKNHQRRILKMDILLIKQKIEDNDFRRDVRDLRDDSRRIK